MNCIDKDILQRYLDGEMDPDQKAQVDKHLKECQFCRIQLELLRTRAVQIKNALKSLSDEEVVRPPLSSMIDGKLPVFESKELQYKNASDNGWKPVNRLIYGIGVACAIILLFLYTPWKTPGKSQDVIQMQAVIQEVDANRPYSEQETVITVIDPDGKVTYLK
ncbi:MAG: anti-sigma factor [Bacteroidales bacterium]|nr:anti-sigma factor [Bacteroidales bacterium]MDD4712658.1 anti-sigma factor [Bacteroidales bacterium]